MHYKLFASVLLFVIAVSPAFSQYEPVGTISIGLKGGSSISKPIVNKRTNNMQDRQFSSAIGFTGGITFHYRFFDSFVSLQPELLYVQKGFEEVIDSDFGTETITTTYNYVQIPYLLKMNFNVTEKTQMNFFTGFVTSFLRGGTVITQSSEGNDTNDISSGVNSLDFGLVFGSGFDFRTTIGTIIVDARYGIGFRDLNDDYTSLPAVYNRYLLVMLGIEL